MSAPALPSDTHRVELVSMDPHFQGISIALYQRSAEEGAAEFLVYSFSTKTGASERVAFAARAMRTLGGMVSCAQDPFLRFDCGREHLLACRRLFLEACKIEPSHTPLEPRPLSTFDKRSELTIDIVSEGNGRYRVRGEEGADRRRIAVAAGGLVKLTDMEALDDSMDRVGFDCGCAHDELVGLLLPRALNVRTVMREIEAAAARGVLFAPSGQE